MSVMCKNRARSRGGREGRVNVVNVGRERFSPFLLFLLVSAGLSGRMGLPQPPVSLLADHHTVHIGNSLVTTLGPGPPVLLKVDNSVTYEHTPMRNILVTHFSLRNPGISVLGKRH